MGPAARADPVTGTSGRRIAQPALPADGAVSQRDKVSFGGIVLVLLTAVLVLSVLSVQGRIVFAMVVLAIIFIPLERLFALRPRKILRPGWRTDVVHYLINGAALKVGIVTAVVVVGTVLRAFVPVSFRTAIAASPSWVQIVAALAITTVGGYAGHRAAHEVPLLWRFHRVHHSVREMDWFAANHLHPLDQILSAHCGTTAVRTGLRPPESGRFRRPDHAAGDLHPRQRATELRPLRWLIATPQFHHWHHAREPEATTPTTPVSSRLWTPCSGLFTYRPTGGPHSTASTSANPRGICVNSFGGCARCAA